MAEDSLPAAIEVEVVYCPARSVVDSSVLRLPSGSTVSNALAASAIAQRHPEIDPAFADERGVGIWGKAVGLQHSLRDGDRVEVYRPLLVEPKDARRLRQRHQLARGKRKPG